MPERISGLALAGLAAAVFGHEAHAQSPSNGRTLYGLYCQVCHSPDPATMIDPFNLIMSAANNPTQIAVAAATWPSQMGFIPATLSASDQADVAAYLATFAVTPVTVTVVEFYDVTQDHYFISASASEIADLDHAVHPGWMRTGQSFKAYAAAAAGINPVCRFYIPPALGDSHFYSASPGECAAVQVSYPVFQFESGAVFFIAVPDASSGACPPATVAVYRLWDGRVDTNHRYTTSPQVKQQMQAQGWIAEGYGPAQVIMCASS